MEYLIVFSVAIAMMTAYVWILARCLPHRVTELRRERGSCGPLCREAQEFRHGSASDRGTQLQTLNQQRRAPSVVARGRLIEAHRTRSKCG